MTLLKVENMTHYFGGLRAVHNYNLSIEPGQIRGLIGPNGAGKTTIFNLITGVYKPTEGKVILGGQNLVGLQPHKIAAAGLGRTFQNLLLWRHMTVLEHVMMARYSKLTYGLVGAFFRHPETSAAGSGKQRKSFYLSQDAWGRPICGSKCPQLALRRTAPGGNGTRLGD